MLFYLLVYKFKDLKREKLIFFLVLNKMNYFFFSTVYVLGCKI